MVRAGRPGLAPAGGRLGALDLNDLGDLEQQLKRVQGSADEPATASAVGFEDAEHEPFEPFCLGGLETEPWDRIVGVDVGQHGTGWRSEPLGNLKPVRTGHVAEGT
jgi:hypothetical protein